MRFQRDQSAIVILLLAFVVGGYLLAGRGSGPARLPGIETRANPAISNDRPSGSKGVFEWVGKLGYQPVAWRQSWERLPGTPADVLVIIDPGVEQTMMTLTGAGGVGVSSEATELSVEDAARLKHWLEMGHTAILLSSRLPSGQTGPKPAPDDTKTFGDAMDMIVESASPATSREEFSPLQPLRETQGILSLHSESGDRIRRESGDGLALFGDGAGPVALEVPQGKGNLIVVADGALFSNENLPRSENAVFLANLLAQSTRPGGTVLFDEYHHGDVASDNTASLWEMLGRPMQLALIQSSLAFAALLVLLSGRFGPPVPLARGAARTSADYVTSVASLYRRAEASGTALETLYRQFLRDLCARLALPPDVNLETLASVAARRGQGNVVILRRLLATCEQRLDEGKLSEQELLELTQQMERVRKDMGIA